MLILPFVFYEMNHFLFSFISTNELKVVRRHNNPLSCDSADGIISVGPFIFEHLVVVTRIQFN